MGVGNDRDMSPSRTVTSACVTAHSVSTSDGVLDPMRRRPSPVHACRPTCRPRRARGARRDQGVHDRQVFGQVGDRNALIPPQRDEASTPDITLRRLRFSQADRRNTRRSHRFSASPRSAERIDQRLNGRGSLDAPLGPVEPARQRRRRIVGGKRVTTVDEDCGGSSHAHRLRCLRIVDPTLGHDHVSTTGEDQRLANTIERDVTVWAARDREQLDPHRELAQVFEQAGRSRVLVRIGKTLDRRGRVGHHHLLLRRHRRPGPSHSPRDTARVTSSPSTGWHSYGPPEPLGAPSARSAASPSCKHCAPTLTASPSAPGASTPPIAILAASGPT
ncbi:hypothetical protein BH24ACT7_BH24ACT7_18570 [soil metagenome]